MTQDPFDLVIRAPHAITPAGQTGCAVGVLDGRIAAVEELSAPLDARAFVELGENEVLLPGLVDTHVHVNEPGRTEWEGFTSATRAAAAGGVTTILDMPLNSVPPTCTVDALEIKRASARGRVHVDVGFWGGAIPGNLGELASLHEAGVFGFKCFLLDSGVQEFPPLGRDQLADALAEVAGFGGLLIAHAEDSQVIGFAPAANGPAYAAFLASRPALAEDVAIGTLVELARVTACRVHVVHLSSAQVLPVIRAARRDGVPLTVETCPHYLVFTAEEIPEGATEFKCCPPIREQDNRDRLWAALADGTIDCVVSDHSPCTAELKHLGSGDFGTAWGGVASLQLGLSAVWTQARARGVPLDDVVRWMSAAPARLAGLNAKGRIAVGCDADLVVFAPEESFVVDPALLHHKNAITPYAGRSLTGVVRRTWLRGRQVAERGRVLGEPTGTLLRGERS